MSVNTFCRKPVKQARPIDAAEVERLFAEGLESQAVARRLGIAPSTFSGRVSNSQTLTEARERGRAKCTK